MDAFELFWNEYTAMFSRLPVWLPGQAMRVGDIGVMDPRGWQRLTDLDSIGVPFGQSKTAPDVSQSRASGDAVDIRALTDVAAGPEALGTALTGGLEVTFRRGGAFLIRTENCRYDEIDDLIGVQTSIDKLVASKRLEWKSRWVLVTQVTTAHPAIVLVAKHGDASARIEIHSSAGAANLADLARVGGELRLASERALDQRIVTTKRVPVMWRGRRRGRGLMRNWTDLGDQDANSGALDARSADVNFDFVEYMPSGNEVRREAADD